jgi:hypothetical protein
VRVILACHHLLATFRHTWRSLNREFAIKPVVAFFVNPFTCQIEVTETAASTGRLNKVRAEELEMVILDLQNDVLKSYATMKTFGIWLTEKSFLP